jgi:hypothetical protein
MQICYRKSTGLSAQKFLFGLGAENNPIGGNLGLLNGVVPFNARASALFKRGVRAPGSRGGLRNPCVSTSDVI